MRKAISSQVSVGEQPRGSDLEELKKDGVTTVANLRVVGEDTALAPAEERVLAEKLGLQYHHLPISLDKLNAAQVKELREILEHSQGQVFVHCGMGSAHARFRLLHPVWAGIRFSNKHVNSDFRSRMRS
jgi:uncharacterized protein (TIGR01244 family)